jgi:hypothetical protein
MEVNSGRWQEVTPSSFAHERSALEYIRNLLPDRHPFQAWSNFTFLSTRAMSARSTYSSPPRAAFTSSRSRTIGVD